KVMQFPLVEGGEGTIEQLITSTLGSFLEVEATSASGEQLIVPLGFAGEGGSIGVIEMRAIAEAPAVAAPKPTKKNRLGFSGTTFGIGELIADALDEGAFSVILGWDEPLAKDAGFGMAQALGVKFLDAAGKQLDFKSETPLGDVQAIDLSSRSFQLMSSKFFIARSEAVRNGNFERQVTVDQTLFENELIRIAALLKKENNTTVDMTKVNLGGSCIEFGLSAFLNSEFKDGGPLALEASNIRGNLATQGGTIIFFAERLEDIASDRAPLASREIMRIATECNIPIIAIINEPAKPASESRYKKKHPLLQEVYCLAEVPLFFAPLAPDAPHTEKRRYFSARLEKLIGLKSEELKATAAPAAATV
ncbi:MAG: glycerate kinase, partial [Bacteroidota bacterium]|nr:glycerate kinase [Bacteroidota bacterium]